MNFLKINLNRDGVMSRIHRRKKYKIAKRNPSSDLIRKFLLTLLALLLFGGAILMAILPVFYS